MSTYSHPFFTLYCSEHIYLLLVAVCLWLLNFGTFLFIHFAGIFNVRELPYLDFV